MGDAPSGIDVGRVTAWLEANVPGAVGPFGFTLIAGGHSNLTYGVVGADGARFVLRRPPLGHVLATAHDMGREYRIISALGPTDVPVPPALGFCGDPEVNGAPFYVMAYVDGHVVRDRTAAELVLSPAARRTAGLQLAEVLAAIHRVDVDAVGLGDLGRRDGYIERQVRRWYRQWEQSKTRDLPEVDEVHRILLGTVPEQHGTSIVHGDYRLDNCMVDDDGRIVAVLDWEICTLGDALADVGLLAVYYGGVGDVDGGLASAPTTVEGFPPADEVLAHYAAVSGRDLSSIDFYVAFGYWKLACILEGVYARYLGGAMGQRDASSFEGFRLQVERCAARAAAVARRLG